MTIEAITPAEPIPTIFGLTINPTFLSSYEETGLGGKAPNFIASDTANLFRPHKRYETMLIPRPVNMSVACGGFQTYVTYHDQNELANFIKNRLSRYFSRNECSEMRAVCRDAMAESNAVLFGWVIYTDEDKNSMVGHANDTVFYAVKPHPQTGDFEDLERIYAYISKTYKQAFANIIRL